MKNLLIIPAAGNAKRLKSKIPKILNIIAKKKKVVDILLKKIGYIDKIIFVVKKKNEFLIKKYLSKNYPKLNFELVFQNKATGMVDAVHASSRHWNNFDKIIVLWGDQVGISSKTINIIKKFKINAKTVLLPLVFKSNLYVQYIFKNKKLFMIKESRETNISDRFGYADVGLFAFHQKFLKNYLNKYLTIADKGLITKETSFLQFIIFLKNRHWKIKIVNIKNKNETFGINNKKELIFFKNKYEQI